MKTAPWFLAAVFVIAVATHSPRADDKCDESPENVAVALNAPFNEGTAKAAQVAWAKHIGKTSVVESNSIHMDMVLIPPGSFTMGSPTTETGRAPDEDQVTVTLTQIFFIGKTEVTQRQWQDVMETTPWKGKPFVREGDHYPATYVSWDEVQLFCKFLSAKEGAVYRLPTEAEWEYACRAGTTTPFSFGKYEIDLGDYAWWGLILANGVTKDVQHPREVGLKLPNPFGLFDVHGNVCEWCRDLYVISLPGGLNPMAAVGGTYRVYRGGAWNSHAVSCRSADRDRFHSTYQTSSLGFRVARSSPVD
jgi:formylglycine-generating enzyme required for sulfatase activity